MIRFVSFIFVVVVAVFAKFIWLFCKWMLGHDPFRIKHRNRWLKRTIQMPNVNVKRKNISKNQTILIRNQVANRNDCELGLLIFCCCYISNRETFLLSISCVMNISSWNMRVTYSDQIKCIWRNETCRLFVVVVVVVVVGEHQKYHRLSRYANVFACSRFDCIDVNLTQVQNVKFVHFFGFREARKSSWTILAHS